jgi:hypothetical protein
MTLDGGKIATRGDALPMADKWPEDVRRSYLRLGFIREVKDGTVPMAPTSTQIKTVSAPKAPEPALQNRYQGGKQKHKGR